MLLTLMIHRFPNLNHIQLQFIIAFMYFIILLDLVNTLKEKKYFLQSFSIPYQIKFVMKCWRLWSSRRDSEKHNNISVMSLLMRPAVVN